jgi:hypothetical protein
VLAGLGLISRLLLLSARQSDPLGGGAGSGRYFLHSLQNSGQSGPLGGGTSCGRFLLPRQELDACEILISYLSVYVDYLGEAHLRYLIL